MDEIKVDVKINVGDMYNFFMYHTYSRFSGLFSIILGLAMFVLMAYTYGKISIGQSIIYFIFGVFFLVFNPINYYWRAYVLVKKNPAFQDSITYIFNNEGITTKQKKESATVKWDDIQKIVASKRSIIIYVNKVRASIIPKQAVGEDYYKLVEVIKKNAKTSKVKL